MEGYKYVAVVNLFEDFNKKDYNFALYEDEAGVLCASDVPTFENLVVVNARGENERKLGFVKRIIPVDVFCNAPENKNLKLTAQVVGVVDMSEYSVRVLKEERRREIEERKKKIEDLLEKEITKRKTVEYYEKMAAQYSDNPELMEMVKELKSLEHQLKEVE